MCHIEDLVIDKNYRVQGLSKELLMYAKNIAKSIIVIKFYSKNNFLGHHVKCV